MARRRRPGSRTSFVDGRAQIIIPVEAITDVDGNPLTFRGVSKWLQRVDALGAPLNVGHPSVALALDRFAWDLHLADVGHATDTHDGDSFFDAAAASGDVIVHVTLDIDPRRAKPEEIDAAARDGNLLGAVVPAFPVDVLQS